MRLFKTGYRSIGNDHEANKTRYKVAAQNFSLSGKPKVNSAVQLAENSKSVNSLCLIYTAKSYFVYLIVPRY